MRCEAFERMVYEGGEITPEMQAHAKTCEACRALLENRDVLAGCAQMDADMEVPPSFASGWRAAVRREAGAGRTPGLRERASAWLAGFRGRRMARGLAYALCACVLVGAGAMLGNGGLQADFSAQRDTAAAYGAPAESGMMLRSAPAADVTENWAYDDMGYESAALEETAESADSDQTKARKILRTAQLSISVADMDEAILYLKARAQALGGAVSAQEISGVKGEGRYGSMELSIPSGQLDVFLGEAEGCGTVKRLYMDETDMSASYYDNESRLESARAQKQRLDELYQQAQEMTDIVTITDAIFDVQQEIDSLAGHNAWIDERADNARVSITLEEARKTVPRKEPTFFEQLAGSFTDGLDAIAGFFGGMALLAMWALPWAALAGAAYALWRFVKRK